MPNCKVRTPYTHISEVWIVGMFEMKESYREIARMTGSSAISVQRVIRQWAQKDSRTSRPSAVPRKRTTPREDHQILHTAVVHRRITAAQIRATVAITVTSRTIVNHLHEAELHSRTLMQSVPLTRLH